MRTINPEHIRRLIDTLNRCPYYQLLSMKLCELEIGSAKLVADLKKEHLNPMGIVHGGAYSSILDTAAFWSAYCELDEGVGLTTIDLSVDFLSMTKTGLVIAEGRSLKIGGSICLTEASARDEAGKLLAHCTSKLMVLHGRQSVDIAVERLGYDPLPPKFLD